MLRDKDLPKLILQYKLLSEAIKMIIRAQEGNTTIIINIYNITKYNDISYEVAYTLPNHSKDLKHTFIDRRKLITLYNTLYNKYKDK